MLTSDILAFEFQTKTTQIFKKTNRKNYTIKNKKETVKSM